MVPASARPGARACRATPRRLAAFADCWSKGALGDALHALCCAAGYNIRWLLRAIARGALRRLFWDQEHCTATTESGMVLMSREVV
ncbi:MAG: hypothetical protein EBS37_17245 [Betaproteobacteria bacterium]|nr:hypothetical protein [Betaproteobacteria bacterium]